MDLIIGGAYQGKLEYAKEKYGLSDDDIFTCDGTGEIDFSKRCIYHFENYLYYLMQNDTAATASMPEYKTFNFRDDAIIIADDVMGGVVPTYGEARAWREFCGRTLTKLSGQCDSVTRIFCGQALRLK